MIAEDRPDVIVVRDLGLRGSSGRGGGSLREDCDGREGKRDRKDLAKHGELQHVGSAVRTIIGDLVRIADPTNSLSD
jgi:hypothetical protein